MTRIAVLRCGLVLAGLAVLAALSLRVPASATGAPTRHLCLDGKRAMQAGDTARAETLMVAALADNPNDACALTNLGNLARLRGEARQARVFYRMALRVDSSDVGILLNLAAVMLDLREPGADSIYREALARSRFTELSNKLALPADSVKKVKDSIVDSYMVGGGAGSGRPPNVVILALIGKGVERQRRRTTDGSHSRGQSATLKQQAEADRADSVALANLPIYWKD